MRVCGVCGKTLYSPVCESCERTERHHAENLEAMRLIEVNTAEIIQLLEKLISVTEGPESHE